MFPVQVVQLIRDGGHSFVQAPEGRLEQTEAAFPLSQVSMLQLMRQAVKSVKLSPFFIRHRNSIYTDTVSHELEKMRFIMDIVYFDIYMCLGWWSDRKNNHYYTKAPWCKHLAYY